MSETTETVPPEQSEAAEAGNPNAEAAKYRKRLREVEAERDALAGQVTSHKTTKAEELAQAEGITPAALWASGITLDELQSEDGNIDKELVTAAIGNARKILGITPPPSVSSTDGQGRVGNPITGGDEKETSWATALRPQ